MPTHAGEPGTSRLHDDGIHPAETTSNGLALVEQALTAPPLEEAEAEGWTAAKWLAASGVASSIATLLVDGAPNELEAMRALGALPEAGRQTEVQRRLAGITVLLMGLIIPKLASLAEAEAATGSELHDKFASNETSFTLTYGDLSTFFGGLEKKIGAPEPKIWKAMKREHMASNDSNDEFTTGNYFVTTKPEIEWRFVAEPDTQAEWPAEEPTKLTPDRRRKPLPLQQLSRLLLKFNERLRLLTEPELMIEEAVGARLYTGPMCVCSHTRHKLSSHTART